MIHKYKNKQVHPEPYDKTHSTVYLNGAKTVVHNRDIEADYTPDLKDCLLIGLVCLIFWVVLILVIW